MMRTRVSRVAALVFLAACDVHRLVDAPPSAIQPLLIAQLEISDSLPSVGSEITVLVRLHGRKAVDIGSFTGRVAFDQTGLTYLGEAALVDNATRVSNPTPGLVRCAGINLHGFGDGPLMGYRFRVNAPAAVKSLRLTMDEMHEANHANAASYLRVVANPGVPQ